jgi:hypothetical protein
MARINLAARFRPEAMAEAMECVIDEAEKANKFRFCRSSCKSLQFSSHDA